MLQKLLFVATHGEMAQAAEEIARERGEPIDILSGDLHEAVEKVRAFDLSGKEAIVCRGGTAQLLRRCVALPVVEVEVSAYDLLRALYPHRERRIAVVGAENVVSGVRLLEEVIGLAVRYYPAVLEEDIECAVVWALEEGVDLVVGDTVAHRVARRHGVSCELVRSGREAVAEAIQNAETICEAIEREREKSSRLNAIVEHLKEGIAVVGPDGNVTLMNRAAGQMLGLPRDRAVGGAAGALLADRRVDELGTDGGVRRRLLHTANGAVAVNHIPILVNGAARGEVITCEEVSRIQRLERDIRRSLSRRGLVARRRFDDILGCSDAIQTAVQRAREYAAVDSTVLLYGESGTGKELFAQSLHNESARGAGPFVAVNCATLPRDLLESTLFGYEEGSFTGAGKGGRKGLFELAHGGTLFLDEIAEIDLQTQAKLLRVLQEREVMRIGGDSILPVDVRVIASSNQRLIRLVQQGRFRADLYYRLSVLNLDIPALRERRGDVALLARRMADACAARYGRTAVELAPDALERLDAYRWPGNVRQLENVMQRVVLTAGSRRLSAGKIDPFLEEWDEADAGTPPLDGSLDDIVRAIILQVMAEEGYNKTRAAERLGITRATLSRKLSEGAQK